MLYEHQSRRPISRAAFAQRMLRHGALALCVTVGSIAIGMAGYMYYEDLPWRDAFLNTAMLMGGMGPVDALHTTAGKLFASIYALYCGLVLLVAASLLFAPILHRLMHRFRWSEKI